MSSAPNFIQQDNARPHIDVHDLEFIAIQSLQYQNSPSNVDELVECCMNEVMKDKGGNNYKVPHMNKERLEREGDLPLQVRCDVDTVNQALALLQK
ncbi:hypothetical protein KY290_036286 [Solanum tuberosum]|uniref:Uncharacterized protein n=1 Tax=Solanum tuberosum TaxID=4113 RepID=A0ABQ7TTU2_SOLTU|nr:hypothetical protein KY285_035567 [Solanum tuberosum]KAH0737581.1 hypothetical protein KY290_036286 [Solanum tuberosum]